MKGGYPRLRFPDGGKVDLRRFVSEWEADAFAESWRPFHVEVEWLRSPRGRLDHILGSKIYVTPDAGGVS